MPIKRLKKRVYHPAKNALARRWGSILLKRGCEVIGITGSAGKTTAKEMIASVLSGQYKVVKTRANIMPDFNIPSTILRTPPTTQKLVLEMGIEYQGDMDFYLSFIPVKVGVVTNVYWTHTQFLGGVNQVASQKAKLIETLPGDGFAILNKDDHRVCDMAKKTPAKVIWFSVKKKADVSAKGVVITKDFKTKFRLSLGRDSEEVVLPVLGEHFVTCALAAAAVGHVCGLELQAIKKGLEAFAPQPHRMQPLKKNGILILDDTYNANPLATLEALKVLGVVARGRRKIFVLGEMKELGSYEKAGHQEVGREIARQKVDILITLGNATKYTINEAIRGGLKKENVYFCKNGKDVVEKIKEVIKKRDVMLIKGSRSMRMEEVVASL